MVARAEEDLETVSAVGIDETAARRLLFAPNVDSYLECAPRGGQDKAAVLTGLRAMKDGHKLKPELFKKQPYFLLGCDNYAALGDICQMFTTDECWSYFQDAGYVAG